MTAYSFKRMFVGPILAGLGLGLPWHGLVKRQTIRAERKRHAREGEELQLYCGMRTKGCFLIGRARCTSVHPIDLCFRRKRRSDWVVMPEEILDRPDQLDAFARRDGFADWLELRAFWKSQHPGITYFHGKIILWEPL